MDCQFIGEDDSTDTSNRRSSSPHSISTARSSQESSDTQTELGKTMSLVLYQPTRTTMVASVCDNKERSSYQTDNRVQTGYLNPRRCITGRMGSIITDATDNRPLDSTRKRTFDQCAGVEDNSLCSPITRKRIRREEDQDYVRQHNGDKIHNEIRRYKFNDTPGPSSSNTGDLQQTSTSSSVPTHSRNKEHRCRQTQQTNDEPTIRGNHSETNIQSHSEPLGTAERRRICSERESATTDVLELQSGSELSSNRRLPTVVEESRLRLFSPVETHPSHIAQDQNRSNTEDSFDHATWDVSTLVADNNEDEEDSETVHISTQPMDYDRMAVIRHKKQEEGLSRESIEYLTKANRESTNANYDLSWRKFVEWCERQTSPIDPTEYDTVTALNYFMANKDFSQSQVKIIRASISSVWKILHPKKGDLANESIISGFFKAKRNQEVRILKEYQLKTWDTTLMITLIKNNYCSQKDLPLSKLQQKTLLVIELATVARPSSELGNLQYRDILFEFEDDAAVKLTIHFRKAKETPTKTIQLQCIQDKDICPVQTTHTFHQKSAHLRTTLPIGSKNIWTMLVLTLPYKPQSIRAAASTKAVEIGRSIQTVKIHGKWS